MLSSPRLFGEIGGAEPPELAKPLSDENDSTTHSLSEGLLAADALHEPPSSR